MFFNSTGTSARKLDKARFTKRRPSKTERKRKRKAQRIARRLNRKQK
ncbi:hypothetical protein ACTL6P_25315 [Endozoicomonas acroporae]|nr:hypothetical protein [Endozoicomonas acroporae]